MNKPLPSLPTGEPINLDNVHLLPGYVEDQGVTRFAGRSAALRAEPCSTVSALRAAATNAGERA